MEIITSAAIYHWKLIAGSDLKEMILLVISRSFAALFWKVGPT